MSTEMAENPQDVKAATILSKTVLENSETDPLIKNPEAEKKRQEASEGDGRGTALKLVGCFVGLQASYLTWGYLQEKVMTKEYSGGENFPSAMFCVLMNRVFAILTAFVLVLFTTGRPTINRRKWLDFALPALSNTLSSFGQYQALRYVPFPFQTIAKSTKVIPVMLMGKLLNNKAYGWREYTEAALISVGVLLFAFERKSISLYGGDFALVQIPGLTMLALYIGCDSFTSQYQSKVFKANPECTQFQMMLFVNIWAAAISMASLLLNGDLLFTMAFLGRHPHAIWDNIVIGITSATGQCFIFYTIKTFGPVTFTIIMTTRQVFSIAISMIVFGHVLKTTALVGVVIVFATLFSKSYKAQVDSQNKLNKEVAL